MFDPSSILRGRAPSVHVGRDGARRAHGRWAFEGFPPNAFALRGLKDYREKLTPGTRITISGWAAKDPAARAFSEREMTFADGSKMLFGPTPEEGDRWKCSSGPCPYKYPEP